MNKTISRSILFLIFISSLLYNLHACCLPDTILIKSNGPDSVISNPELFVNGSDTTDECDIYLTNSSLLKNVRIAGMKDSEIVIMKDSVRRVINAADIKKIVFRAGAGFWKGALIGMGISLA